MSAGLRTIPLKRRARGTLFGFGGILGWSVYGVLVASVTRMPPFLLLCLMFSAATVVLVGRGLVAGNRLSDLIRVPRSTLGLGVLGMFGSNAFFVLALAAGAEAIPVVVISLSWPVLMVLIVTVVGSARPNKWDLLALGLGFTGMAAVAMDGGRFAFHPGLLLALLGGLSWAVYSGLRPLVPVGPPDSVAAFVLASGLLAGLMHLGFGESLVAPPREILAAAMAGAIPVGIANLFWDIGVREGDPVLLAGLAFVEPAISASLVVLFLGKAIEGGDVIGLVLVAAGIGASILGERVRRGAVSEVA